MALDRPKNDQVVSIRAPARGATRAHTVLLAPGIVSIRAPARGATAVSRTCQ